MSSTRSVSSCFFDTRIILSASSSAVLCLILYFLGKVHKYLTFFSSFDQQKERKKGNETETKKMILERSVLKCKIFFVLDKVDDLLEMRLEFGSVGLWS
jgi:hypothetical protein